VRELRNLIERSLILGEIPDEFRIHRSGQTEHPAESLQETERRHIMRVLQECGGNRAEAARRLGISRKTIDRKCAMWNA
jgi:DNA-binding NtrC family response regulator